VTGNDIVDINVAAAESNWKRKGFLQKIFTPQEQQYISNAALPDDMVWKLWTMKESAYKVYTRQHGGRFFAPQKFSCTVMTEKTGIVEYGHDHYQTDTISAKKYIYSIASLKGFTNTKLLSYCFFLPQTEYAKQQQFIYEKIVAGYNAITGVKKEDPAIVKDKNGIPFLHCSNNVRVPISITHHGYYAAFTIN